MMKIRKYTAAAVLALALALASCGDGDSGGGSKQQGRYEKDLRAVVEICLDAAVIPQNAQAAAYADSAYESISALEHGRTTQGQVDEAARYFQLMRLAYEGTEGFFLGANTHYDVDSDINNWPLDVLAFRQTMADGSDLTTVAGKPSSIVGFHGLEYILFRGGRVRRASSLTAGEIVYAKTLIANLRLRLCQVECGWNAKAPAAHVRALQEAGLKYQAPDGGDYRSYTLAHYSLKQLADALIAGDHGIVGEADEIAYTKLLRPYSRDSTYIESPFSQTSLEDLACNMESIRGIWFGYAEGNQTPSRSSFDSYFKKYNAPLAARAERAISACDSAIAAIPAPLVSNCHDASVKAASDAFIELSDVLKEASSFIDNQE